MSILDRLFVPSVNFALLLANMLSFFGTGTGIYFFLGEARLIPGYGVAIAAGLASLAIQLMLIGFWNRFTDKALPKRVRIFFLMLAKFMSLLSMTLAIGFWSWTFGLDQSLADIRTAERAEKMTLPLWSFEDRFDDVSFAMTDLSNEMVDRRLTEFENGDSCDGTAVDTGEGPRTRLAERLELEASQHATMATGLAQDARKAADLPVNATDDDLKAAFDKARDVTSDPRIRDIRRWIEGLIEGFEGTFTDPKFGTVFECGSVDVVTRLRTILDLVNTPVPLPSSAPDAVEGGLDTALRASFSQTFEVFGWLVFGAPRPDEATLDLTRPAITSAAVVELVIIVLSIIKGMTRPAQSPSSPMGNPITPDDRAALEQKLAIWNACYLPGRYELFLVPEDGPEELREAAYTEVNRWRMSPMPAQLPVDLSVVAPEQYSDIARRTGGARRYRAYRVPSRALSWRRQATVDLYDSIKAIGS